MISVASKELFRLWWIQKIRSFRWKDAFVAIYLAVLFIVLVVMLHSALGTKLDHLTLPFPLDAFVPLLSIAIIPSDLLMKLFLRRSPVEMDDYLRSRPVGAKEWAWLVLLDSKLSIMQLLNPLCIAFVGALFIGVGWGILIFFLSFTCSLFNSLIQNCWRRAPKTSYCLFLLLGYLVWLIALLVFMLFAFFRLMEWGTVAITLSLILYNSLCCYLLHRWFTIMKSYSEETHKPVSTTAHSLGSVSLWSIEWVQLLRSSRLRTSFLVLAIMLPLTAYLQQVSPSPDNYHGLAIDPTLLLSIAFPSILMAQWVLGVEANYFSGIWTKPWSVEGILRRKYYFFCTICLAMSLIMLPAVIWLNLSLWTLLSILLFSCGAIILPLMATCLYSSRIDLFGKAFFNYQGANKQLNAMSLVLFIPLGLYFVLYALLPMQWAHLAVCLLGLLGIGLHSVYIHWITNIWHRRRYEIMERWK